MKNLNEQLVNIYNDFNFKMAELLNEDKDNRQIATAIDNLSSEMSIKFVKLFDSLEDFNELLEFIENDEETSEDYKELIARLAISKLTKDMLDDGLDVGFVVVEMNGDIPGGSGKMN